MLWMLLPVASLSDLIVKWPHAGETALQSRLDQRRRNCSRSQGAVKGTCLFVVLGACVGALNSFCPCSSLSGGPASCLHDRLGF